MENKKTITSQKVGNSLNKHLRMNQTKPSLQGLAMNKYSCYLTDEIIDQAVAGDETAMAIVVKSFDPFISWCATPNNIKGHFRKCSYVDEDVKKQLITKLLIALQKFRDE